MGRRTVSLLVLLFVLSSTVFVGCEQSKKPGYKVAILAGHKSHPPGYHEYIKSSRLIKTMLEKHCPEKISVHIYYDFPDDHSELDDVNTIVVISDGRDGHLYRDAPHVVPERVPEIEKQMERGCGLVAIHFSTFVSNEMGDKIAGWNGGYFDWQDDNGERNWYSNLLNLETVVKRENPDHPVNRGVNDFHINEEFYYNLRFPENATGWAALVSVPELNTDRVNGKVVAWAIEREDGGRGFGTTMGHHFASWKNPDFRKLVLNGIVWSAGMDIPSDGIEATFYEDDEVTAYLFNKHKKALILTGDNIEAHEWQRTTAALQSILENGTDFHVDISDDIEDLGEYNLDDYDLLVLNYCNWNKNDPPGDMSKAAFTEYLSNGGGLMILHFSNGAFHYSLPYAGKSDWPEYRKICRRVWDHHSNSSHDDYGPINVLVNQPSHPITEGLEPFAIEDELYFNQKGTEPLDTLISAKSKITGNIEALAWHYQYGNGRVFQSLLGHNEKSYDSEGYRQLLMRAANWTAKRR
jgi:type 1 glutamine amidotransferase